MQKKLGELYFTETMEGTQDLIVSAETKINKSNDRRVIFYRNGRTITCIFKSMSFKGIGVAKCNPKDKFNMSKGIKLAEMRARQDFYSEIAKYFAKR